MSDIQKNATQGRPKGCLNYHPEFKQRLIEASFQPGVSISRLALDNGINANLLFKWHQKWRQGKIKFPSESDRESQLISVTIDAERPSAPAHESLMSTSSVTQEIHNFS
ncbi:transposase [Enterobacter sp. UPMP2052]